MNNRDRGTDHAATGLMVVAPSTLVVDEPFDVRLKVLTTPYYVGAACYNPLPSVVGRYNTSPRGIRFMDNVPPHLSGRLLVDGGDGYLGPESVDLDTGQGVYARDQRPIHRLSGITFATPGTKSIVVTDPQRGLSGVSNPIEVTAEPPTERLFWGDLHCPTFMSDGLRCPEELYAFARDEAFLDIFSLADHSESLTDRQWEYFTAVTNDFNDPGRFVTLVSLEWTSRRWGHRNVHYPGERGPCLRCDDPIYGELPNLYAAAREHGALVIPHHSANREMGVDWSLGHDPRVERLVEIHSVWGNSERPASAGNPLPIQNQGGEVEGQHVVDALRMGRRLGFVGGGDTHDGRPGDELHNRQDEPANYHLCRQQGLMGVWAPNLTRQAIFEALWKRRVYATTRVRVLLRFCAAGTPMGGETEVDGPFPVTVEAKSSTPIARVEIVQDGEDVASITPGTQAVHWREQLKVQDDESWVYARVTREDGEMAWSSPVWVRAAP